MIHMIIEIDLVLIEIDCDLRLGRTQHLIRSIYLLKWMPKYRLYVEESINDTVYRYIL